jgi:hypothetical protein
VTGAAWAIVRRRSKRDDCGVSQRRPTRRWPQSEPRCAAQWRGSIPAHCAVRGPAACPAGSRLGVSHRLWGYQRAHVVDEDDRLTAGNAAPAGRQKARTGK